MSHCPRKRSRLPLLKSEASGKEGSFGMAFPRVLERAFIGWNRKIQDSGET
jgi:hypothetical protein